MKRSLFVLLALLLSMSLAQEVVIGWSGAVTGPTSDAGQFVVQGLEDYCAYANENELVPGHEIKCLLSDDQYNNDNTLRNFEGYLDAGMVAFIGYATGATMQLKVDQGRNAWKILVYFLFAANYSRSVRFVLFLPPTLAPAVCIVFNPFCIVLNPFCDVFDPHAYAYPAPSNY